MSRETLQAEIESARASGAYQNYLQVRERVLEMLEEALELAARSSNFWEEELAGLDYMLDASPLIIRRLREHCTDITGLRAFDYRSHHSDTPHRFAASQSRLWRTVDRFARKLSALQQLDKDSLLVEESQALGGFGHVIDGRLVNIDTLKFYECLIALSNGEAIEPFRSSSGARKVVLEIGAGWGGFAYQFKTLFPNVTYVIVDLPLMLLFSGVYLKTLFPSASVYVYGDGPLLHHERKLEQYDFVFLPHYSIDDLKLDRLDLTINMCSFMEMTSEQVDSYAGKTLELGCQTLYSMNRDRSRFNDQLTGVSSILGRYYDVAELAVLGVPYTDPLPKGDGPKDRPAVNPLRHPRWWLREQLRSTPTKGVWPDPAHNYRHLLCTAKTALSQNDGR